MKDRKTTIVVLIIAVITVGRLYLQPREKAEESAWQRRTETEKVGVSTTAVKEKKEIMVKIVSPEEETFMPRQARMWSAKIENFEDEIGKFGFCEWRFYLNENNEEVFYKEQAVRTVLSTGGNNTCGFTSTFIESQGKLRAEVTVLVKDFQENLVTTYKAERNYIVQ